MSGANNKTIARVWSQYEQVKNHVSGLHIEFISSVNKIKAIELAKMPSSHAKSHKIAAFQSLSHLMHFAVLSGAILDKENDKVKKVREKLKAWDKVTTDELLEIVDCLEEWFSASYFYDVRVSDENKQIVDIHSTLKAAGL